MRASGTPRMNPLFGQLFLLTLKMSLLVGCWSNLKPPSPLNNLRIMTVMKCSSRMNSGKMPVLSATPVDGAAPHGHHLSHQSSPYSYSSTG